MLSTCTLTHRHTHGTSTLTVTLVCTETFIPSSHFGLTCLTCAPLTSGHTHTHTCPAIFAHSHTGSHLFTLTKTYSASRPHTQPSAICTPTLILSLGSDTHVMSRTHQYPQRHSIHMHTHTPKKIYTWISFYISSTGESVELLFATVA